MHACSQWHTTGLCCLCGWWVCTNCLYRNLVDDMLSLMVLLFYSQVGAAAASCTMILHVASQ